MLGEPMTTAFASILLGQDRIYVTKPMIEKRHQDHSEAGPLKLTNRKEWVAAESLKGEWPFPQHGAVDLLQTHNNLGRTSKEDIRRLAVMIAKPVFDARV